ncbi:MAG: prolyl oligopeptidase family serine peptidase, partial [Acidobacteriota bacterium]
MRSLTIWIGVGCLLVLPGADPAAAAVQLPFTAADMLDVVTFAGGQPLSLSPDGRLATFVLPDMDDEWNVQERRPTGFVQVVATSTPLAALTAVTAGNTRSSFPVWSPDGTRLALFVEEGGGNRLAVYEVESRALRRLGEPFDGRPYLAARWTPDGGSLIYAPAVPVPPLAEPGRVRVQTNEDSRLPGDAFFTDRRLAGLVAVDLASGSGRALLGKPVHLRSFTLSPGGEWVTYTVPEPSTFGVVGKERHETFLLQVAGGGAARRLDSGAAPVSWSGDGQHLIWRQEGRLVMSRPAGGERHPLLAGPSLEARTPIWSPDGKQFLVMVPDPSRHDPEIDAPQPDMYTIAVPFMDLYLVPGPGRTPRNLTSAIVDQIREPVFSGDGRAVFFRAINPETYDETLYRYSLADGRLHPLRAGRESYGHLAAAGERLVVTIETATHPPDLWAFDRHGTGRRLTDLNPQLDRFTFSAPELFFFHDADGERLGALLYRPVSPPEPDAVPVITYVYEKLTPGIHRFRPRQQIFLTHGFAMLMPNVKVKVGETGTSFVKSVVPAVNAVRGMGFAHSRFALWGGSFGAYATSFVITKTDIFACAVSRATPPDLLRNWASGRDRDSLNIERGQARMGGGPFEVMNRYLDQSAFFHL